MERPNKSLATRKVFGSGPDGMTFAHVMRVYQLLHSHNLQNHDVVRLQDTSGQIGAILSLSPPGRTPDPLRGNRHHWMPAAPFPTHPVLP
ncbi:hypothetical protein UPYG_G00135890 [Umbra pygmaea]|uniref:Uncharacterized protein n=1 Tax=Umbra pygmaea TaxID=75934 RepID=A0ABD0XAQ0_UMBPY